VRLMQSECSPFERERAACYKLVKTLRYKNTSPAGNGKKGTRGRRDVGFHTPKVAVRSLKYQFSNKRNPITDLFQ
jgi:hypothetical protein